MAALFVPAHITEIRHQRFIHHRVCECEGKVQRSSQSGSTENHLQLGI
jgi:hypothetical protein